MNSSRSVARACPVCVLINSSSPIVDEDERGGTKASRPTQGTPPGGVLSPLLGNVFLHYFDKLFHRADGPARWANANSRSRSPVDDAARSSFGTSMAV